MDDRSYIDLDHGKTLCSSLTLALYLSDACLAPMRFLWTFRREIEQESATSDASRLSTPINDALSYRLPLSIKEKYVLANRYAYYFMNISSENKKRGLAPLKIKRNQPSNAYYGRSNPSC